MNAPRFAPSVSVACVVSLFSISFLAAADKSEEAKPSAAAEFAKLIRPQTPGDFNMHTRSRIETESGEIKILDEVKPWKVSETAIIICDMWDDVYCQMAAQRVDMMAPHMNEVVTAARAHGALVIHAPSGCMDFYKGSFNRQRAEYAPHSDSPLELKGWCYLDPETEAEMPVVTEVSPCDDPITPPAVRVYTRQHEDIKIIGYDAISDSGQEVYNLLQQEGIKNVVMMGVHTNMCVLGRPFGIRQLTRLGYNVALARDLTDAMYDPRQPPYVSHTRGTELVIEHIEQYWCPSIKGSDLIAVIPGSNDPLPEQTKPAVSQSQQ
ncbi:Isochorismatase family protein [Polystyrenella longa]|uniref:Isochorismatase family protein n=1 Tax=Polystyrenella longa TaxID=2528007 RepID=A0A518CPU6_9PLAN|nr:cysteine hydrolase family protein [Polystyrenella longa]QDU81250.1 Isochorismatase family protein [Polystyrenella longa]